MLGAMAGCCVHTLLAALGLSALLAASATAFTVLKVVGALYLLWLAVDAVRHGSALQLKERGRSARSPFWKTFLLGLGINLTNPKVVLFFVTFLPQFVQAGDPHAAEKLVFLGLYFVASHGSAWRALMIVCRRPGDRAPARAGRADARHRLYLRGPVLGLRLKILATSAR